MYGSFMYSSLCTFLDDAMEDDVRVEVTVVDGEKFTALSLGLNESHDELGWDFGKVEGVNYSIIDLKDIALVKRLDTQAAWTAAELQSKPVQTAV